MKTRFIASITTWARKRVQNLLVLRFANTIFEPIWNRNYIDHVQITVAESVDVGSRAGYYDKSGVVRDMIQNHLLQLMMICAMEAPARFEPELVRDEKAKVLRSVRLPSRLKSPATPCAASTQVIDKRRTWPPTRKRPPLPP